MLPGSRSPRRGLIVITTGIGRGSMSFRPSPTLFSRKLNFHARCGLGSLCLVVSISDSPYDTLPACIPSASLVPKVQLQTLCVVDELI